MYHDESITQAYEGAGWAFPVEMLEDTFMTQVHFQGLPRRWTTRKFAP